MSPEIYGSSRGRKTKVTAATSKPCNGGSPISKPVFDIAYAGPRNRFTIRTNSGHLLVHNCGFGGWINASKAFGSTETDEVIKAQILAWRKASPGIVELWGGQSRGLPWDRDRRPECYGYEGAAVQAIRYPGQVFTVFPGGVMRETTHDPAAQLDGGVSFFMRGHVPDVFEPYIGQDGQTYTRYRPGVEGALIVRLLSGRELTYQSPRLSPSTRPMAAPWEMSITYMTWNSNPKYGPMGWGAMSTFGGRLTENIVQAIAHDILRYAILALRAAGYPCVLHVYDEILAEIPEGLGSLEEFERIMATMPPWALDWPIRAAGGWRAKRYRKG